MIGLAVEEPVTPLDAARRFFEAVRAGRAVDALELFAQDAEVRDERGRRYEGIRAIAAFVARNRSPQPVEVEELRQEGDRVLATVSLGRGGRDDRFRYAFTIRGGRVVSLRIDDLTGDRTASRGRSASAAPA